MTNIAIVGCNGKMGYFVASAVKENPEAQTLFGIDAFGENKHDFAVYKSFEVEKIKAAGEKIAIFYSGNMSLGINLLIELSKQAAKVLGGSFDIEILEKHHNLKLDAPSGTALMIADGISETLPQEPQYIYDRHTMRRKRTKNEIGIHSVRGGTIVGEHEVIFAGHDEVVTITHQAQSKEVFAVGAVNAAVFLAKQGAGMYSMSDLLADKF